MQKSCLPKFIHNNKPNRIYQDYITDPKTGCILPLITLVPMILTGITAAASTTSAVSDVANTIINAIRGLTNLPIDYKYTTAENTDNNNKEDFSCELWIMCRKCKIITQTDIPHTLFVKDKIFRLLEFVIYVIHINKLY